MSDTQSHEGDAPVATPNAALDPVLSAIADFPSAASTGAVVHACCLRDLTHNVAALLNRAKHAIGEVHARGLNDSTGEQAKANNSIKTSISVSTCLCVVVKEIRETYECLRRTRVHLETLGYQVFFLNLRASDPTVHVNLALPHHDWHAPAGEVNAMIVEWKVTSVAAAVAPTLHAEMHTRCVLQ